jgi:hypothetical protein
MMAMRVPYFVAIGKVVRMGGQIEEPAILYDVHGEK